MVIAHNLAAMNANRQLKTTTTSRGKSCEKLSSGYRINRAADDAAGLSISEKMRKMIRGLDQGSENIQDGISMCQIADGALSTVNTIICRMEELAIQSANGTNSDSDRYALQSETQKLLQEINRIGETTTFNGMSVFCESPNIDRQINSDIQANISDRNIYDSQIQLPPGRHISIDASNLSQLLSQNPDGSYELEDGMIYTFSPNVKNVGFHISQGSTVSVVDSNITECGINVENATLFFQNSSIINERINSSTYNGAPISILGNSTLNFIGSNSLQGGRRSDDRDFAAIGVNYGNSVEINGNGSVNCLGAGHSAAIGNNYETDDVFWSETAGNITINSGKIIARSTLAAGIGGCSIGESGNIVINGGDITCTSVSGAGIGTGYDSNHRGQSHGSVTINGGNVYAKSIQDGAGIGGGGIASGIDVTITGGHVTAYGGNAGGAGIGSGSVFWSRNNHSGQLVISGGIVEAYGSIITAGSYKGEMGSAIGQGVFCYGYSGSESDWRNGFRPVQIDGIMYDSFTLGRNPQKLVNNVFFFRYPFFDDSSSQNNSTSVHVKHNCFIQTQDEANIGILLDIGSVSTSAFNLDRLSVSSEYAATSAIRLIDHALQKVSLLRSRIGAMQNRLEHAKAINDNTSENTQYAESRIRDTDMAEEMLNYSKQNILEQAGHSMLSQAMQMNQGIARLLQ